MVNFFIGFFVSPRCPDDPLAAEKFQALGQAYQTLSNEQARATYDKNGKSENENADALVDAIDTTVFFNVMFGSTLVEPYVGELWIASIADLVMKDMASQNPDSMSEAQINSQFQENLSGKTVDAEDAKMKQSKRELLIAMYLREKIQSAMNGKVPIDDFAAEVQMEAFKIADGSFGATFLTMIGFQLEVEADEFIGFRNSVLDGYKAQVKKSANATSNNLKITGAAIKAAKAGRTVYKDLGTAQARALEEGKTEAEQEQAQAMFAAQKLEDSLPAILDLAWAINGRDVSRTLKNACNKLFSDAGVDMDQRLKRAKLVKILGEEFLAVGKLVGKAKKEDSKEDIKARAEVAVMTTMAKAQGQEVTSEDTEEMIKQQKQMAAEQAKAAAPSDGSSPPSAEAN